MNIEHKFIASLILETIPDSAARAIASCKAEWFDDFLARTAFVVAQEHGATDLMPKLFEHMPEDAGRIVNFLDLAEPNPERFVGAIRSGYILREIESNIEEARKYHSGPDRLITLRESLETLADGALRMGEGDPYQKAIDALNTGTRTIKTGIPCLDRSVKMRPTNLIVIAARPKTGKSAFGTTVARMMTGRGLSVDFHSAEMDDVEILARIAASVTGVENSRIIGHGDPEETYNNLSPEELERVIGVYRNMAEAGRFRISDAAGCKIGELAHRIATSSAEVAIVDYIQLIEGIQSGNREQEVASVTRLLKRAAKKGNKLVIALSQLNRESEKNNRRPGLSDLRESGAIEQDADSVVLMHMNTFDTSATDSYIDPRDAANADNVPVEAIVAKARHGRTGIITLRFDKPTQRFYEQETRIPDPIPFYEQPKF